MAFRVGQGPDGVEPFSPGIQFGLLLDPTGSRITGMFL